ncbi:glycerophosphodiester phosphodiesterase [Luteolibacter algae]|uniref:Glycerophosphodiester phosphodiesterase n=1 Tax=Luteolibacter algae TaxID=454151 RepID=A0ABW5D539_9BACT
MNSSSIPLIIAHRGASAAAPENTMPAFEEAWRQGADGIEIDIRLTKDGEIVAIHDADTLRTCGVRKIIAESDWQQLENLMPGNPDKPSQPGTRIPRLSEILADLPPGKRLFIEVKCGVEIVETLAEHLLGEAGLERFTIISFHQDVIRSFKELAPGIRANWITDFRLDPSGTLTPGPEMIIRTLKKISADGLSGEAHPILRADFGEKIITAGFDYHVWTVDDSATAGKFIAAGVSSLTTNLPGKLREDLLAGY